jgi:hypothetical protein
MVVVVRLAGALLGPLVRGMSRVLLQGPSRTQGTLVHPSLAPSLVPTHHKATGAHRGTHPSPTRRKATGAHRGTHPSPTRHKATGAQRVSNIN